MKMKKIKMNIINNMKKFLVFLFGIFCSLSMNAYDWEHVSLSGGAEAIANYSWRGFAQGGVSFQPWLEFSTYGLTIGTWASVGSGVYSDFNKFVPEIDVYLSYTCPGDWVSLMFTHYYYFEGEKYFNFAYDVDKAGSSQTEVELTVRPLQFLEENNGLEIGAAVMIGGGDYYSGNGAEFYTDATETRYEKLWSTYIYFKYAAELIDNLTLTSEIGFSPNKSLYTYYNPTTGQCAKAALNNIGCKVDYTFFSNDIISIYALGAIRFNLFDVGFEKFAYGKNFGWNVGIGFEL